MCNFQIYFILKAVSYNLMINLEMSLQLIYNNVVFKKQFQFCLKLFSFSSVILLDQWSKTFVISLMYLSNSDDNDFAVRTHFVFFLGYDRCFGFVCNKILIKSVCKLSIIFHFKSSFIDLNEKRLIYINVVFGSSFICASFFICLLSVHEQ